MAVRSPARLLLAEQAGRCDSDNYRGDLTQIDIGHDNTGPDPGWHLDSVRIFNETK